MAQQYIFQIYVILSEVENMQKKYKIKKKICFKYKKTWMYKNMKQKIIDLAAIIMRNIKQICF